MAAYSKAVPFLAGLIPALYICYHFSGVTLTLLLCTLGVVGGSALALLTGEPQGARRRATYPKNADGCVAKGRIASVKQYPSSPSVPVMFSTSLDSRIQEVLDLLHRHHVAPFYSRFGSDPEQFYRSLQPEAWSFLAALKDRLYKVDMLQLMSQDTVNVFIGHLRWLRKFGGGVAASELQSPFQPNLERFPHLAGAATERAFLRQACDVLLCVTLPRGVLHCSAVRSLAREFLVSHVVLPCVDQLCDPDFLNQRLLAYLEQREKGAKKAKTKYAKAATYEEFVKYLERCSSVEELQHTRELILVDIVQARAVLKMKRERVHTGSLAGPDIPMPTEKVEKLRARKNLPAYAKQLHNCMLVCDKRIKKLGGGGGGGEEGATGSLASSNPLHSSSSSSAATSLRPSFDQLLAVPEHRRAFAAFLSDHGARNVLQCWEELEQLRDNHHHQQQQQQGEDESGDDDGDDGDDGDGAFLSKKKKKALLRIHRTYFVFSAPDFVDLDPSLVQQLARVLEDSRTDQPAAAVVGVVGEVMRRLAYQLQCQFYHSFLSSHHHLDLRQRMAVQQQQQQQGGGGTQEDLLSRDPAHSSSLDPQQHQQQQQQHQFLDDVVSFSEEAEVEGRHEKRLRELKSKLEDIERLLEALPPVGASGQMEGAAQRRRALERQRRSTIEEQHQLENYLDRMSDWYGSLGEWTVTVSSTHDPEDSGPPANSGSSSSSSSASSSSSSDPLFMILIGHVSTTVRAGQGGGERWGDGGNGNNNSDSTFEDLTPSVVTTTSSSTAINENSSSSSLLFNNPTTTTTAAAAATTILEPPPPPLLQSHRRMSSTSSIAKVSEISERASVCSEETPSEVGEGVGFGSGRYRDGWVVHRRLSEFKTLHARLSQMNSTLRFPKLVQTKSFIGSLNVFPSSSSSSGGGGGRGGSGEGRDSASRYGLQLSEYLSRVVRDERLQSCELVFLFLSPPYQLVLGSSSDAAAETESDRRASIPSTLRDILPRLKVESLVDPMFSLMVEIFELGDWKMVFRKRLVNLIQFAFGSDLDRQVQEAVAWYVSEPMMLRYLETFRDTWWPGGQPQAPPPARSEDDRRTTREQVRAKLLKNPPFFVQSIVGSQSCQQGLEKLFLSFQDPRANRQLLFAFLEVLVQAAVPELRDIERDLQDSTTPT